MLERSNQIRALIDQGMTVLEAGRELGIGRAKAEYAARLYGIKAQVAAVRSARGHLCRAAEGALDQAEAENAPGALVWARRRREFAAAGSGLFGHVRNGA